MVHRFGQCFDRLGGVQCKCQWLAAWRFQGRELAVDEAGRHEVPWASQHAFFGLGRRQFEEHEHQPGHGIAQGVAVAALECRAGQDRAFTGLGGGLQLFTKADQPAGTVAVVQRDASAHLADVFGRVESVAFDQAAAASGSDGGADAAFATTGYAHHHNGGQGRIHQYLLRVR